MPFCCQCRNQMRASVRELIDKNAWCPSCRKLVSVSLCKVPIWVITVVAILSMNVRIMAVS